jgi:hypothetical protein
LSTKIPEQKVKKMSGFGIGFTAAGEVTALGCSSSSGSVSLETRILRKLQLTNNILSNKLQQAD